MLPDRISNPGPLTYESGVLPIALPGLASTCNFVHILSPVTDNCPSGISGRRNESMWPDQVSNPGPLTFESGALPTAIHGPAIRNCILVICPFVTDS